MYLFISFLILVLNMPFWAVHAVHEQSKEPNVAWIFYVSSVLGGILNENDVQVHKLESATYKVY